VGRITMPIILKVTFIILCFVLSYHNTRMFISNMAFFVALLGYTIATKSVSIYQWYHALAGE
jgi:hypothetical protein